MSKGLGRFRVPVSGRGQGLIQALLCTLLLSLALSGCRGGAEPKSQPTPGGQDDDLPWEFAPENESDSYPTRTISPEDVADAVPKPEPRSAYGNRPVYEVRGKTYRVLEDAAGYSEQGLASWYGVKFHGRRTSSGEPYDMYKASAAHRSLPLPSYAEVTNLENGKRVIVRVNDRGPFHSDRIIDLSYGAAIRLGYAEKGTARVAVRAITFDMDSALPDNTWLQAGAFTLKQGALDLEAALEKGGLRGLKVDRRDELYRVYIGPFKTSRELEAAAARVVELGYMRPHKVTR